MSPAARWVAVSALLLAGCASPAPPPAPAAPPDDATVLWSGCSGAVATLEAQALLDPSEAPDGWAPASGPLPALWVVALECGRVSWGRFERGPVAVVLEWHTAAAPPPACTGGERDGVYLLRSIWFDDRDLAGHARSLGLPAGFAEAAVREEPLGAMTAREWSWGPPGAEPSTLSVADAAPDRPYTAHYAYVLAWGDGAGGAGLLDFSYTPTVDDADPPVAWGTLRAPMLHGEGPVQNFASRGYPILDLEARGELRRFGDLRCAEPL